MALLLDGGINTLPELSAYDSSVLNVAAGESIDLTQKLVLAQEQIRTELGIALRTTADARIGQVVSTPEIKRWHAYLTLSLTYMDAYFSQLNDRYKARWQANSAEALSAAHTCFRGGIGLVETPLHAPQKPTVSVIGGTVPSATYWIGVTISGTGGESALSELTVVSAPDHHSLSVPVPVTETQNWNVYAGYSPAELMRQNPLPIVPGQIWTLADGGLQAGAPPSGGQDPDRYWIPRRSLLRG